MSPASDSTAFTQVIYRQDASGDVIGAEIQGYDATARTGFRFYDLSGNGRADEFTLTAPADAIGDFNARLNAPGWLSLNPVLTTISSSQFQVADPSRSDRISLRLAGTLLQRATSVSQIGYVLLEPGERAADLPAEQFRARALSLFSSLGPQPDTLPQGSRFEQEILISNGQQLALFQAQGTTISALSGPADPRLQWFESQNQASPQQLQLASADGSRLGLELRPGVQGVDALIGALQDQAPLLDLTAISPLRSLRTQVELGRDAIYDAICGFYTVLNADGTVQAADGRLLNPGDLAYREEALRADNISPVLAQLQVADRQTSTTTVNLHGGAILAPYARVNGDTYFYYGAANRDGQQHFQLLGRNQIGLEDLPGLGDNDCNDVVMVFRFLELQA